MIKKLVTIMAVMAFTASINLGQWQNLGAWPDDTYKGGTHGIAVDPDGKVWQSSYYKENWITPNNDTIKTSPIYVFNADGSLNTILYTVTDGAVIDSLTGACRGMGKDENGNILYTSSGPTKLIKINYQTFARMGSQLIFDYIGSSPTAPSTDNNGNIFVGPVVGGGTTAIAIFDTDLNYLGNAVVGPPNIARTMEVSPDGNTIYWTPFTALKTFIYSRPDEFSAFELTDSAHFGMSIETSAWHPVTGLLWISNDKRGTAGLSDLTWYAYDVTTKTLVDSFSLPVTGLGDEFPRGLDFSPDGKYAYVGLFGTAFDRIYRFTNVILDSVDLFVTYQANMELERLKGTFNPATDTVEVRGEFFGWGSEAPNMVQSTTDPDVYEYTAVQKATVGDNLPPYKFFYYPGNWEGGDNRTYKITQADYDNGFAVVSRSFNDASLETVLAQDATILFTVDTKGAVSAINNTAFTTVNTVHITGAVAPLQWPDGGWPDAQIDRMLPMYDDGTNGDVTAGDGVFSANITFPKYTGLRVQYKYGINYGDAANNQDGNDNENGVGADHFINMTSDLVSAKVENVFGTMGDHALVNVVTGGSTNLSLTFEAGENGADWTWTTFGPDNAPLAIIPNPDMTEPNTSSTVLQFTASFPGDPWAGFFSDDIGEFTFDETNSLVKVMVWKPVISNFGVKFEGASPAVEKLIPNTVTGAWEELTYDFSDQIGNTFNRLVFLPDFGPDARTQNNVLYIDNLTFSDISTDIDVLPNILPNGYALDQNYPNPFNPTTQIRFQLKNQEDVTLKVYNMLGQEVATLLNEKMSAGVYDVKFDASQLSSGIYVYTLKAGKFFDSKKMTLLK